MTKLGDLKAVTTAKPLDGVDPRTTLSLSAEDEIDEALHALGRFFAEDDSRTAVQLEVHGDKVGYLNRRDFLASQPRAKFGEAQPAELPGPPEFTFIKLACMIEGCETVILKIHHDERNPERCPIHPNKILYVVA